MPLKRKLLYLVLTLLCATVVAAATSHTFSPQLQPVATRALRDPLKFYDPETRNVINLPENYLGVAARLAAIDYQLGLLSDRAMLNTLLDRAAHQFTGGALYADDAPPTGRFDRYSNEYAR